MQQQLVAKLPGLGSVGHACQKYFGTSNTAVQQVTYAEFGDPSSENVVYYQHGW